MRIVERMALFSCHCQYNAMLAERNAHNPHCSVGMAQEFLGRKVSWELNGNPVGSPLETVEEMEKWRAAEMERQAIEHVMQRPEVAAPKCVDCGSTKNVTLGPCPYASEINDDNTELYLCGSCRHERAMDI